MFVLPVALSGQVVNNCGGGDSLPCAWRTLDQTEGPLQDSLHSIHLNTQEVKAFKLTELKNILVKFTKTDFMPIVTK